jgi:hypothetical protein
MLLKTVEKSIFCKQGTWVRCDILTAKMSTVFWVVTPCRLVGGYQSFDTLNVEVTGSSETLLITRLHSITSQKTAIDKGSGSDKQ